MKKILSLSKQGFGFIRKNFTGIFNVVLIGGIFYMVSVFKLNFQLLKDAQKDNKKMGEIIIYLESDLSRTKTKLERTEHELYETRFKFDMIKKEYTDYLRADKIDSIAFKKRK